MMADLGRRTSFTDTGEEEEASDSTPSIDVSSYQSNTHQQEGFVEDMLNSLWRDAKIGGSKDSNRNSNKTPSRKSDSNDGNIGMRLSPIGSEGSPRLKSSLAHSNARRNRGQRVQFQIPEEQKSVVGRVADWLTRRASSYIPKQSKVYLYE